MSTVEAERLSTGEDRAKFRWDWVTFLLLGVLGIFVGVAFSPAVKASFVDLDDQAYVFNNANVLNGLSLHSIKWALTSREDGRYMPTAWLSLQLDATISKLLTGSGDGTPASPGQLPDATVYHVTNIVLHTLATWILFLFLYRMTRHRWASFVVALLWAVHPLRVESVAWVTERKDEVAGVFGFLAIYLYVVSREKNGRRGKLWFWSACVALVLSLWAKAMFVSVPLLLLIVDYWPLGRIRSMGDFRRAVIEKWPMWGIAALSAIGTMLIGRSSDKALAISQWEKAENAFLSYIRYLVMHVDFRSLAPYYPYVGSPPLQVCGALAILTMITGFVIWKRKRWPWLFAGWFWYLIALLPVIGFVQSFTQAYADRFSYLGAVGLLVMAVFGIAQWRRAERIVICGGLAAGAVLTAFSFRQTMYWHDSVALFEHALDVTPPSYLMHWALAHGYQRAGRTDDAERELRKVIEESPQLVDPRLVLATLYVQTNRVAMALSEDKAAVEAEPDNVDANRVYGSTLLLDKQYQAAVIYLEKAHQIAPDDLVVNENLRLAREGAAANN